MIGTMKAQDRINALELDLAAARAEQDRCSHEWGPVTTETRYRKEGYGSKQDGAGSDPHWTYEGYRNVPYTIHVRVCLKCGLRQETEKVETKPTGFTTTPIF